MSAQRVLIIDTSILCVWLRVPGLETCGSDQDRWDHARADEAIQSAIQDGYTLVLPLATLIESGNHIAHAPDHRFKAAQRLAEVISKSAERTSPWAAFTDQSELWSAKGLMRLASEWPGMAKGKFTIGDATIKQVAEYYAQMGNVVQLLTADRQLSAYEPPQPPLVPRRRKR